MLNLAKVGKQTQPRSGERIQPTAQAVGKKLKEINKPRRGERTVSIWLLGGAALQRCDSKAKK